MCHFALRLFVALLTFGVGIAASTLFGSNSPCKFERRFVPAHDAVLVAAPAEQPPRACSFKPIVSGGILNGKVISQPAPVYPAIARAARAHGTVAVQVTVDENGDVVSAQAISGHPLLQAAAVEAARQAKISPTFLSGQPVRVTGTLTYNFALE
ncbi:MAG TPA: energy transducer TonB [Pyrinomonadaceae bacterium]|nr:energy transducer TonB [Pyrinomonadaceae bacterium]